MKEVIQEHHVVTTTIYIADDNERFESEADCKAHDAMLARKEAENRVKALPGFYFTAPLCTGDETWQWLYIRDEKELNDVLTTLFAENSGVWDVKPSNIPGWIVAVYDDDGYGSVYTLEEYQRYQHDFELLLKTNMAGTVSPSLDTESSDIAGTHRTGQSLFVQWDALDACVDAWAKKIFPENEDIRGTAKRDGCEWYVCLQGLRESNYDTFAAEFDRYCELSDYDSELDFYCGNQETPIPLPIAMFIVNHELSERLGFTIGGSLALEQGVFFYEFEIPDFKCM